MPHSDDAGLAMLKEPQVNDISSRYTKYIIKIVLNHK